MARPLDTLALRALLITDEKPGHYHQSEGVLAAIARIRSVEIKRLVVRRSLLPTRVLHRLVNAGVPPSIILRVGYGVSSQDLPAADVIVSAGGETLAANAAAARILAVPNIFCGRLRRLAPEHVRLVLVPYERFRSVPNHLVILPPAAMEVTRPEGEPLRWGPKKPPALVGVLIGGNTRNISYTDNDWLILTRFLREGYQSAGIRWLVTTSRRSGHGVAQILAAEASDPASGIARFIDYRTAGPGTVAEILTAADAILVTTDSTSMITEGVYARLPVIGIARDTGTPEEREAEYRSFLTQHGWYRSLAFSDLTAEKFLDALSEVTPRQTSPLDELATALSGRLPEIFSVR